MEKTVILKSKQAELLERLQKYKEAKQQKNQKQSLSSKPPPAHKSDTNRLRKSTVTASAATDLVNRRRSLAVPASKVAPTTARDGLTRRKSTVPLTNKDVLNRRKSTVPLTNKDVSNRRKSILPQTPKDTLMRRKSAVPPTNKDVSNHRKSTVSLTNRDVTNRQKSTVTETPKDRLNSRKSAVPPPNKNVSNRRKSGVVPTKDVPNHRKSTVPQTTKNTRLEQKSGVSQMATKQKPVVPLLTENTPSRRRSVLSEAVDAPNLYKSVVDATVKQSEASCCSPIKRRSFTITPENLSSPGLKRPRITEQETDSYQSPKRRRVDAENIAPDTISTETEPTSTETEPTSTETEPTSTETEPTSTETEPTSTETAATKATEDGQSTVTMETRDDPSTGHMHLSMRERLELWRQQKQPNTKSASSKPTQDKTTKLSTAQKITKPTPGKPAPLKKNTLGKTAPATKPTPRKPATVTKPTVGKPAAVTKPTPGKPAAVTKPTPGKPALAKKNSHEKSAPLQKPTPVRIAKLSTSKVVRHSPARKSAQKAARSTPSKSRQSLGGTKKPSVRCSMSSSKPPLDKKAEALLRRKSYSVSLQSRVTSQGPEHKRRRATLSSQGNNRLQTSGSAENRRASVRSPLRAKLATSSSDRAEPATSNSEQAEFSKSARETSEVPISQQSMTDVTPEPEANQIAGKTDDMPVVNDVDISAAPTKTPRNKHSRRSVRFMTPDIINITPTSPCSPDRTQASPVLKLTRQISSPDSPRSPLEGSTPGRNKSTITPVRTPGRNKSIGTPVRTPGCAPRTPQTLAMTPRMTPLQKEMSMREKLDSWLVSHGKTPSHYKHLLCFGDHLSHEDTKPTKQVPGGLSADELAHQQEALDVEDNATIHPMEPVFVTPDPVTERLEDILSECSILLESDCPPATVSQWLEQICGHLDGVKQRAKYWICKAKIAELTGDDSSVISVFEESVRYNAQPPEEVADALKGFVKKMSSRQATRSQTARVAFTPRPPSPTAITPRHLQSSSYTPRHRVPDIQEENIITSSAIRYCYTETTPFFTRLHSKARRSCHTPMAKITPVRRSMRLSLNTDLPDMLKDHDLIIDSLECLPEEQKSMALFKPNRALHAELEEAEGETD